MEQLKLNMIPNGVNPVFHASQYDKGRQIRFVLDETLSGAKVTVSYRAKDGTEHGNVQMSVSGNTITDTIPEEVLTDYGIVEGEVNIDGIGSLNFFVEVEKDAYDGGVITTQTASGAIATFNTNMVEAFKSLKSDINPVQDLHGYDSVWIGGAGKNKLNYDAWKNDGVTNGTGVWENNGVTLTANANDCYTSAPNGFPSSAIIPISEGETITLSWEETTNKNGSIYIFPNNTTTGMVRAYNWQAKKLSYTATSGVTYVTFRFGVASSGDTISYKNIQIEKGSTATAYEPYENICPISGFSALNVTLADGDMQTVESKTVNFGQTVYGGVADVTNGKVTITHIKITDFAQYYRDFFSGTYSTEYRITLPYPSTNVVYSVKRGSLCNCKEEETAYYGANQSSQSGSARDIFAINPLGEVLAIYDADTTLTKEQFEAKYSGNIEFVYELATPIEITTTPENLTALSGQNNVYSDTNGDTTVEYYIEV